MMKLLAFKIPRYSDISLKPAEGVITPSIAGWENIGQIISRLLTYIFPIAGILTLIYLIYGGIHLMTALGNEEGIREAKAKITNAIIGFLIVFASYWIVQILEIILGVQLL